VTGNTSQAKRCRPKGVGTFLISGMDWATYSAAADQAYRIQQAIAQDLATYLSIPLTMDDRRRLAQDPDGSHLAYDYYVTGQRFLDAVTDPRGADSAAENFRQALRIAPDSALAHVGLSEAVWQIYHRDHDPQSLAEAEREAEAACRIDPNLPTAKVALARVHRSTGNHSAAIDELKTRPVFIALVGNAD
jgi:cytochrome c-type biogenesis protein CcmH/NrfG